MLSYTENKSISAKPLLVILGPTASGKSALAIILAKKFNGEIISADSRQVYRGLDVGSGKITKKEMHGILHYCLDIANPKKQFSVAEFEGYAKTTIEKIYQKGKLPIVVGGSGMYIDAVLYGAPYPSVPPNAKLRKHLEKKSVDALFMILQKKDLRRAKTIDRYNKRRLIRALEILAATKKPIPPLIKTPHYNALLLGIKKNKNELSKRIKKRLLYRLSHGMVKEIKKLLKNGVLYKRLFELGLEYRYVSEYCRGACTKKEMTEKLLRAIIQFAKRQETWFRQYPDIAWIQNTPDAEKMVRRWLKKRELMAKKVS